MKAAVVIALFATFLDIVGDADFSISMVYWLTGPNTGYAVSAPKPQGLMYNAFSYLQVNFIGNLLVSCSLLVISLLLYVAELWRLAGARRGGAGTHYVRKGAISVNISEEEGLDLASVLYATSKTTT